MAKVRQMDFISILGMYSSTFVSINALQAEFLIRNQRPQDKDQSRAREAMEHALMKDWDVGL